MNVPEGTQETFGKGREGSVCLGQARGLHNTNSKQVWEQLRQEGFKFEGWPRLVRMQGLVGLGLCCPCDSGKADSQQLQACLSFLLPDVTCSSRWSAWDRAGPHIQHQQYRALLFSCPDPEVMIRSQNQEPVLLSILALFRTPANHIFRLSRGSLLRAVLTSRVLRRTTVRIWLMLYQTAPVLRMLRARCATGFSNLDELIFIHRIHSELLHHLPCFAAKILILHLIL